MSEDFFCILFVQLVSQFLSGCLFIYFDLAQILFWRLVIIKLTYRYKEYLQNVSLGDIYY